MEYQQTRQINKYSLVEVTKMQLRLHYTTTCINKRQFIILDSEITTNREIGPTQKKFKKLSVTEGGRLEVVDEEEPAYTLIMQIR